MIRTLGASLVLILVFDLCFQHRAPETLESVRIELNHRTPSWDHGRLLGSQFGDQKFMWIVKEINREETHSRGELGFPHTGGKMSFSFSNSMFRMGIKYLLNWTECNWDQTVDAYITTVLLTEKPGGAAKHETPFLRFHSPL